MEKEIDGFFWKHYETMSVHQVLEEYRRFPDFFNKTMDGRNYDGEEDGFPKDVPNLCSRWAEVADLFSKIKLQGAATNILKFLWDAYSKRQLKSKKYNYRAYFAYKLGETYQKIGDHGSAIRWFLLAHIADLISGHDKGLAGLMLEAFYGVNNAQMSDIKSSMGEIPKDLGADWSEPEFFPEYALTTFVSRYSGAEFTLGRVTTANDFGVCPAFVGSMLKKLKKVEQDTQKKGDEFETLASYLFGTIPVCFTLRNVMPSTKTFENDIVITNRCPIPTAITEIFGRRILVECKNTVAKPNASVVGYFLYRMHLAKCKIGILFSDKDATGKADIEANAAQDLIRRAMHNDSLYCLIVSRNDIEKLSTGEQTVVSILSNKLDELRFGKPRGSTKTNLPMADLDN